MTPERVAEIYAEETGFDINDEPAALQDFARRMWNEAIEAALNECWKQRGIYGSSEDCVKSIRELKLPEE